MGNQLGLGMHGLGELRRQTLGNPRMELLAVTFGE
jgi:hypothetical protein